MTCQRLVSGLSEPMRVYHGLSETCQWAVKALVGLSVALQRLVSDLSRPIIALSVGWRMSEVCQWPLKGLARRTGACRWPVRGLSVACQGPGEADRSILSTVAWFSCRFMVFHEAERSLLLTVAWFSWPFMVFHEAERPILLTVAWFSLPFIVFHEAERSLLLLHGFHVL